MAWYNNQENKNDVVLSSRVRLARNLEGYPFASRLGDEEAREIIEKVGGLLEKGGFASIDFTDISPVRAGMLWEKHYVSHDFVNKKGPHTLMLNESMGLAVMLCEEDHIRIQSILGGLALDKAYQNACAADDYLSGELPIAYHQELGFLTHCPTNLGTAMRASVMMFLPALTMAGRIGTLANHLSKIGLTMRGFYGEGTGAQGALYQISNQITLGITEEDMLRKLSDAVRQIVESEHELRALITPEKNPKTVDRICRAEGVLRHAYLLSSDEFLTHYADVRLGVALGLLSGIDLSTLDTLLIEMMPYNLAHRENKTALGEKERDLLRAKYIKEMLKR